MEDIPSDPGKSEAPNPNTSWWPSDLTGKLRSVSLMPEEQNLGAAGSASNAGQELSPRAASQILWSTGTLSSPIPNGFYSIIPVSKFHFQLLMLLTLFFCHLLFLEIAF